MIVHDPDIVPADLVIGDHKGRMVLAIPFITIDDYFGNGPRPTRWTVYLAAAIYMRFIEENQ